MKIKTRTDGIKTREEYEMKVNECAELEVQLRTLSTQQDAELQRIRDKYEDEIQKLTNRKDSLLEACSLYASMHMEEVLKPGLRRGETSLAIYGFSLGKPTLVLLSSKHTWDNVIEAIVAKGEDWVEKYLTNPAPKPNKDAIKAKLNADELAEIGCCIEQTDTFYVKAKDNTEA